MNSKGTGIYDRFSLATIFLAMAAMFPSRVALINRVGSSGRSGGGVLKAAWPSPSSVSGAEIGVGAGVAVATLVMDGAVPVGAGAVGGAVGSEEEQAAKVSTKAAMPTNQNTLLWTRAPKTLGCDITAMRPLWTLTVSFGLSGISLKIDN